MNEKLKDAYEQYRSLGFILQQSAKNQKHAHRKGSYQDRDNEPYTPSATGYVAIIPKNIIIVDNDSYKDDGASFSKLCNDLGYIPEAFAITPSGGEHYAFENKKPDFVIGKTIDKYPALDIYAGYQSVIPIVGTTVLNKQGKLASYEWASFDDTLVVNEWDDNFTELFNMRERSERNQTAEYDDLDIALKAEDMPLEEVEQLISELPENLDYDTWLEIGMAIYDRFGGSEEGYKYFNKFSAKSSTKYDENLTFIKWHEGHLIPNSITYKRLRLFVASTHLKMIENSISDMKSDDNLQEIIEKVKNTPKFNTVELPDNKVREKLANQLNSKLKKLKKDNPEIKIIQARTLVKELSPEKDVADITDNSSFALYRLDNKYLLRVGNTVIENITAGMLSETMNSQGIKISKDELSTLKYSTPTISNYTQVADYLLQQESKFTLEQTTQYTPPKLVLRTNPIYGLDLGEIDEEVYHDFNHNVWGGKLEDMIRLIALTIKFKESKLNRLMVIAPSNSGKSEIFTMLDFQKVTMPRLLAGMRGDKGVGEPVIRGIRKTGLLLIDEANKALPAEIKDMDKELHIDQFGSNGTQILPLHFTALTSTHKEATRNNSDEIYNRFLQVELLASEMKYQIIQSPLFLKNGEHYSSNIKKAIFRLFKETIDSDADINELRALQAEYRVPLNTDLNDLLLEISYDYINHIKINSKPFGDIVERVGEYFIKRKKDAKDYFDDRLSEIKELDVPKYSELLLNHFIPSENRNSIRIDGKPIRYYKLELSPYTDDEEEKLISEFDNLELDEF